MSHYHFIGIGGIGMSALAHILLDRGFSVSGSDRSASKVIESLAQKRAVILPETAPLGPQVDTVVYSTAVSSKHPCLQEAKKRNLRILHRSALLQELMQGYRALLVAGTHGKTTTSSLLTHVLCQVGLKPSYAIGGIIKNLKNNGGSGEGIYFVAEADESDGSFSTFSPWGGIVTNIDNDHLDYWKTPEALLEGFKKYLALHASKEHLFWCIDNDNLKKMRPSGISYGFSEEADLVIKNFCQNGWENSFDVEFEGKEFLNILLPLIGGHNILNAAAVFGLCLKLGIGEEQIRGALYTFEGVERRADKKGEWKGIPFYDDYGHHPTEILATLRAIKAACPKHRLVVAFQPHRYTRTRDCLEDFKEAFSSADLLIITDIYAAGEAPIEGITASTLISKIGEGLVKRVHFCPRKEMASFVIPLFQEGDVFVTMGAGDITQLSEEILTQVMV